MAMTFEEKTSDFDSEFRDDRYYLLIDGDVKYQTDDIEDLFVSLGVATIVEVAKRNPEMKPGIPISFDSSMPKAPGYPRDSINVVLYPEDAPPELLIVAYGVNTEQWQERQPEILKRAAKNSPEEVREAARNKVH